MLLKEGLSLFPSRSRFSRGLGEHAGLGFFEEGNHLITCNSRKSLQEVIDRFAPSKYSINVWTGTRVPAKTGVPPSISDEEEMTDPISFQPSECSIPTSNLLDQIW